MEDVSIKKEKGITLIALVITIIVLLILAGVTINLTIGERGIFTTAQRAAKNYTDAQEKELAILSRYEFEIEKKLGNINETETYEEYVIEQKIKATYGVNIKIGDTVNYEDGTDYDGEWKVLGIEDGKILLMSSKPVNENFTLKGKEGFFNLESKLDEECAKYGTGKGAESARSLRVEDINRITGYNPENPEGLEKCYKDTVAEYGETTTFTLEDGHIKYTCSNGQILNTDLTSLSTVDGRNITDGAKLSVVNNDYFYCLGAEYIGTNGQNWTFKSSVPSSLVNLFFETPFTKVAWLGENCIEANPLPNLPGQAFACYYEGRVLQIEVAETPRLTVGCKRLYTSDDTEHERSGVVFAVIELSTNINLSSDGSHTWQLKGE